MIESYENANGTGLIRLINYGPHHPVHFQQKHILQNEAWCKKGAIVFLEIVPMEVTPYKYEGRNIVVCKNISNLVNEKPILQEQSINPKSKPLRKKMYADLMNEKTQDFSKRMNGTISKVFKAEKFGLLVPDDGMDDIWFDDDENNQVSKIEDLQIGDRVSFVLRKRPSKALDAAIDLRKVKSEKKSGKILRITNRGFGFIQRDDTLEEVWFHNNDTLGVDDIRQFKAGDCVSFFSQ